jgi:hypothetical protein
MSQMLAEIKRIVLEDVSSRITQYDVLYEAITNSIHANSTKIDCVLQTNNHILNEDGVEIAKRKLDNITVMDNGDGLNKDNYKSFCKYRTEYNKEFGCKGVGRFIFLKVYKNAKYVSRLLKDQEEKNFTFDFDFDTENIKVEKSKVEANSTQIQLTSLTQQYFDQEKQIDRRIPLDLEVIKEKVLWNLIPTLYFYKKKGVTIEINFVDQNSAETVKITEADIPDFIDKPFVVADRENVKYNFTLHYQLKNEKGKLNTFYCANNRTVCDFSEKDLKISLPFGYSGFFLLEGDYLNSHVNNERNEFDIFPIRTDVYSTLSWEMINSALKNEITSLVKKSIPDTEKINAEKLASIQEERPYLINYIDEKDIDMAGFLDKKHIIDKAKKNFDVAKEKLIAHSGKENYSDADLNEAIQITQNELVAYIFDRAQVLERLKKMVDDKEKIEKIIHNLFMEKSTTDDYFCIGKNNLWLLDDRFTSYSYAASDKRIKDVLKDIGEDSEGVENPGDKPDLSLFFSHNPQEPQSLKSVLIEIKPFDYSDKSDRKKHAGIQQLVDYVKAFKTKENIEEIFAFLITDVDAKLAERLKGDDYTPLFSTQAPIFHRFFKELGISIYVISAKTLILDAEARNKVFLDIIKKQSRLNKLLTSYTEAKEV